MQTVDFFTPVVDDPYAWGAIAAANSFSDVYAMGGMPLLALNLVGWPMDLDFGLLARLLEGGADKAAEAGVSIIGGHTVDDREPKYGMSVTGVVHPDRIVRTSPVRPGCALVLTKPLSTGIISTAIKRGEAGDDLIDEAVRVMSTLNASAAEAMTEVGPVSATDVTGFGLIGHLHNMLRSSEAGAELWPEAVPLLDGVVGLAERDLVPGGTRRNEQFFGQFVDFDAPVAPVIRTILFDAQTSGGLLVAVEASKTDALVAALQARKTPAVSVVGRIVADHPGRIHVVSG